MSRTRTFTWADPAVVYAHMRRLSGLEFLRKLVSGEVPAPPMADLMDIRLVEVDRGRAVFAGIPGEFQFNLLGTVHGGMAATMLDSALGCCVNSCLEAGDVYTTLELKVNYVRPLTLDTGLVRAIGTILHVGRTTAVAEGRLVDAADKLYAYASCTCLITRAPQA